MAARAALAVTEPGDSVEKLIAPLVNGVAIKNILSGLVICGHCNLAMTPASSPTYTLKSTGERRRYVQYKCSRAGNGACENHVRVPEDWLRKTVIDLLCQRLFSDAC
jgi:hypothetical protein